MKNKYTYIIIANIIFSICFFLSGCEEKIKTPECSSIRIIEDSYYNGKYMLQLYKCYPGWINMRNGDNLTLEQARNRKRILTTTMEEPKEIK